MSAVRRNNVHTRGEADPAILFAHGFGCDQNERIFNPYTQATYNTAMKFGGTGLGLAITRKLLALYGSTAHVTSVPGEGSRLFFNLRLAIPKPAL